jgi:membrane fusion protein, multidrug efflux system
MTPRTALARLLAPAAALLLATALQAAPRTFDGLVLPFKNVVVSSPVQSTIISIHVKEGDRVAAGQLLSHLYAKLEELDMLRAKADLEKKAFDAKSSRNLFADKIISEDEALKNRSEMEGARLLAEMAEETFRQRTILAPISGIVVEKNREVGETVSPAEPMFRIVDISKVYVQFYIPAEDLHIVRVGEPMLVKCPVLDKDAVFKGVVDFIDPRVDAASGLLRVKVIVDNPDGRIRAGIRADVSYPDKS